MSKGFNKKGTSEQEVMDVKNKEGALRESNKMDKRKAKYMAVGFLAMIGSVTAYFFAVNGIQNGNAKASDVGSLAVETAAVTVATTTETTVATETVVVTESATATVLVTQTATATPAVTTAAVTATPTTTVKATSTVAATATVKATATATVKATATAVVKFKTAKLATSSKDGVTLHAFNWSYKNIKSNLAAIAAAGYTTIQTSPVQQPKDYSASYTNVSGQWWKMYQPLSFSVAKYSWLGTSADLKALCTEADKYKIKIICDIVANHMASTSSSTRALNAGVKTYEPTLYNSYTKYFHSYYTCNDNSILNVVRGNIGMPDLNTGNTYVQGRVTSLLKQCIDLGVDGFRFDAAKHIETSKDGSYASTFWSNVLTNTRKYALTKNVTLYIYGEILNTVGGGRNISAYTGSLNVTDNRTGDVLLANVKNARANFACSYYYYTQQPANKLVIWAESHDTYMGSSGSGGIASTKTVSQTVVDKAWAIAASRAGSSSLYFVRPGTANMGAVGSSAWKGTAVAKVNFFHNYFTKASEHLSYSGTVVVNERYFTAGGTNGGVMLVNVGGASKAISGVRMNKLGNGTYYDQITGNKFTVSGGKISGTIGSTGIAVVY